VLAGLVVYRRGAVGVYRKRYESRWSRSYKVLVRPIEVSEKVAHALQAASTEVSF